MTSKGEWRLSRLHPRGFPTLGEKDRLPWEGTVVAERGQSNLALLMVRPRNARFSLPASAHLLLGCMLPTEESGSTACAMRQVPSSTQHLLVPSAEEP